MTILIAGGGIAGLTAALSLHQIGIDCRVFETVATPQPLGVGINLLPHAVRELSDLGLQDAVAETAIPTAELAYYTKHGQRIWSEPRGRDAGYNWPQFSIHRGELQLILLQAVRTRLGADHIVTGHHLTGWKDTGTGIRAHFIDRRTNTPLPDAEGDLLVAADGIHSAVRHTLYPTEGPPIWNGAILWRGTTRASPFLTGRSMIMAGHEFQKFVAYPISRTAADNGEAVINWIAEIPPGRFLAPGRLEPPRQPGRFPAAVRQLAVRLAGPPIANPGRRPLLRIPHGGSRSARPLDLRTSHPPRRRRPSDVPDRLQRRVASHPRRPRAGP
jgi:2-polyprenyl-6-methoxyphenol hydroxylase-like FAD-dependent oxidoreductase